MIEVGDTFEVVKVLRNDYKTDGVFKVGGATIRKSEPYSNTLLNGEYKGDEFKDKYLFNQQTLFLKKNEIKPIGRLKVRRVK